MALSPTYDLTVTGTGSTADYGRGGCAYGHIGPIQGAPCEPRATMTPAQPVSSRMRRARADAEEKGLQRGRAVKCAVVGANEQRMHIENSPMFQEYVLRARSNFQNLRPGVGRRENHQDPEDVPFAAAFAAED